MRKKWKVCEVVRNLAGAMDPCPFVRITVENLALMAPVAGKPVPSVVHPSSSPCFCKIKLKNFPLQTAVVPHINGGSKFPDGESQAVAATFHLGREDLDRLSAKSIFAGKLRLKIAVYTGRTGAACGLSSGRLLGRISVPVEFSMVELRAIRSG